MWLKNKSLQAKIMALFIIMSFVLSAVIGSVFYRNTKMTVKASKEMEISTLSKETANKIERFLFERSADIKVLGNSKLLVSSDISKALKSNYLENVRKAYKTYDDVFMIDLSGNITISSSIGDEDEFYKQWIDKVLAGESYISDFVKERDGKYFLYLAEPLRDTNGKIQGAVVEKMNFNAINDIVKNVKPGLSGHAYYSRLDKISNLEKISKVSYFSKNGIKYISATYPIKRYKTQNNQWILVVQEPVEEAFEVINNLRNYFLIVILISLLALCIFAIVIARFITQPMRVLMDKINKILQSNNEYSFEVKSNDEIKSLTNSFDILLEELHFMVQQVLVKSSEVASIDDVRKSIDNFFSHIPNGIITIDSKGKIIAFNNFASKLLMVESHEVIGKNIYDELSHSLNQIIDIILDSFRNEKQYSNYYAMITRDNISISILISTFIQKDMYDNLIGLSVVFKTAEDAQKFKESIVRAKSLAQLGELSAGIAHEIRNPLSSIKGYAQYILSEIGDNEQIADDIFIIISEVDRLNNLIERFLTFARPNEPKPETCNINKIINEIINLCRNEFDEHGIKITTYLDERALIKIDYDQIKQVLLNIVKNSAQSIGNDGEIKIITVYNTTNKVYEIHIVDNGIGIDKKDYERIFEPFFTTKSEGTGLGLAICSRIIENHGGVIEFDSELGKGSCFSIKIPLN